jgi:AraC-like DNA-binding protein/quercetin dioxygenase-like cupin family protein
MLHEAISAMLETLACGRIEFFGPPAAPAAPPNAGDDATAATSDAIESQAFYAPQFHPSAEIIFCIAGRLRVHTNGRWDDFAPGTVRAFLPGAVHSECRAADGTPYRMLWTVVTSASVAFHITAYDADRSYWLAVPHTSLAACTTDTLVQLAADATLPADPLNRFRYQAILMDTLCLSLRSLDALATQRIPHHREIVEHIRHHIDHNFASPLPLQQLADRVHYSPCHLNAVFRELIGVPIRQYILRRRLEQAEHLLKTSSMEIKQIAYAVGFADPLYFSRLFRKRFGASPNTFRR